MAHTIPPVDVDDRIWDRLSALERSSHRDQASLVRTAIAQFLDREQHAELDRKEDETDEERWEDESGCMRSTVGAFSEH